MKQPEGFGDGTGKVANLLLSLYGIKQGSHLWNKYMHQKLISHDFICLLSDHAVYTHHTAMGTSVTAIYIDNALTIASSRAMLAETCCVLHSLFKMKEEDPDWLMGFKLSDDRKNHTVTITQAQYTGTLLKRLGMADCNPVSMPLDPGLVLSKADCLQTEDERKEMARHLYQEALRAITWLAVVSRPNLAYASSQLGQYSANPGKPHWKALTRVLHYLKGTQDVALTLGRVGSTDPDTLTGHTDASWVNDLDDQHSTSGYVFQLGDAAIMWNSKKQHTIAVLSTEAEYMALSHGAKQALWLCWFLHDVGLHSTESPSTTHLSIDNTGTITLAKEAHFHAHTKHINMHYHFVCEHIEDGTFEITHVPTMEMLVDRFTKPLTASGNWGGNDIP